MPKYTDFAAHTFDSLTDASFDPRQYSRLKFGSSLAARNMGYDLADRFFRAHGDAILSNKLVIIPSPYNYIRNAATLMTENFINRLNELCVMAAGRHVEYSIIHRKVSYTNDYGFMSKEKRKGLIDNDEFYMNEGFYKDKLLVFIDDVRITGTHEEKLREILKLSGIPNNAMFVYYAAYTGSEAEIEAKLNFADVKSFRDYLKMAATPDHQMLVRPMKYILGQDYNTVRAAIEDGDLTPAMVETLFYGCLAEGYYKIPSYQANFGLVSQAVRQQRTA